MGSVAALDSIQSLSHGDAAMDQDRDRARFDGAWPWFIVLIVAGLIALAVVLWQSEVGRLLWGNLWELLRSRRGKASVVVAYGTRPDGLPRQLMSGFKRLGSTGAKNP
jgi:hypothetical protein